MYCMAQRVLAPALPATVVISGHAAVLPYPVYNKEEAGMHPCTPASQWWRSL